MSFSTVGAQAVFFTVVVGLFVLVLQTYNDYTTQTGSGAIDQHVLLKERLETALSVEVVAYNNATDPDTVTIDAVNDGSTELKISCLDVYVDRTWISDDDFTAALLNTSVDPQLWNPGETLRIAIQQDVASGDHEVTVVTCNGVAATRIFAACCG